jgi:hypothetical protein
MQLSLMSFASDGQWQNERGSGGGGGGGRAWNCSSQLDE